MKKTKNEPCPITPKLVKLMLEGLDFRYDDAILVLTDGNENLVNEIKKSHGFHGCRDENIDVMESDPDLCRMFEEDEIRVIHDDIETFETLMRYDGIVMASLFYDGETRLMKALDLLKPGGTCVCLLNTELTRNSRTPFYGLLEKRLKEWNFDQTLIPKALKAGKQKMDAAIVKGTRPEITEQASILLEKIKWDTREEEEKTANAIPRIDNPAIQRMISQCYLDQKAGLALMNEYGAMQSLLLDYIPFNNHSMSYSERSGNPLMKFDTKPNKYIRDIRKKYWQHLFVRPEIANRLPENILQQVHYSIDRRLKYHDFNETNILAFQSKLRQEVMDWIKEGILKLFCEISGTFYRDAEPDNANIIPFHGYQTDLSWKIKPKVTLSWRGLRDTSHGRVSYNPHAAKKLCEAETLLDFMAGTRIGGSTSDRLKMSENAGETRNIMLRYLKAAFFKKGTTHIEFLDPDLLEQLNIFACRQKNWLPPDYGKTAYEALDDESRSVVDSFQGEATYREVCRRNNPFEDRLEALSLFTLPD